MKSELAKCMAAHMADTLVRHEFEGNMGEAFSIISEVVLKNKEECICYYARALKEYIHLVKVSLERTFNEVVTAERYIMNDMISHKEYEDYDKRREKFDRKFSLMNEIAREFDKFGFPLDDESKTPEKLEQVVDYMSKVLNMDETFEFIPVETYMDEILDLPYYQNLLEKQRNSPKSKFTTLKEIHEIKAIADKIFKERVVRSVLKTMGDSILIDMSEFTDGVKKLVQESRMMVCMDYFETLNSVNERLMIESLAGFRKFFDENGIQYTMGTRVGNTVYVDGYDVNDNPN